MTAPATSSYDRRLAIHRLRDAAPLSDAAVKRFLSAHEVPIVEGERATFLYHGPADRVRLLHRIVELADDLPLRRIAGTNLWYVVLELPAGSRVEYRLEVTRDGARQDLDDPLNPRRAHNPFGSNSVCYGAGYRTPTWTQPDPDAPPGRLEQLTIPSRAMKRACDVTLYLPARLRATARYPLLVVHDGGDYLRYAAAKVVLDNLVHRRDVAELVVAFLHPGDRLVEYPDHAGHARFVTEELVAQLEDRLPLVARPSGRCLMGASFGAVASLSTAARYPDRFGALILQSGSFVFTEDDTDHGGGRVFDPVVEFVDAYRAAPSRVADRVFVSCGTYEPLIARNRAMVPTLRSASMEVRLVEARDGHNWENWRDRLRDALSWVFPGERHKG